MNLLTTNERGWATFVHQGNLTTVSLSTTTSASPINLNASTLKYFCQLIANLNHKAQKKSAPLQIAGVFTISGTFVFTWKTNKLEFDTIAFLTQAAPELVSIYRQSVADLAGE